jgi:hypothetical protein
MRYSHCRRAGLLLPALLLLLYLEGGVVKEAELKKGRAAPTETAVGGGHDGEESGEEAEPGDHHQLAGQHGGVTGRNLTLPPGYRRQLPSCIIIGGLNYLILIRIRKMQ